jgi:hypothetical protein
MVAVLIKVTCPRKANASQYKKGEAEAGSTLLTPPTVTLTDGTIKRMLVRIQFGLLCLQKPAYTTGAEKRGNAINKSPQSK